MNVRIIVSLGIAFSDGRPDPEPGSELAQRLREAAVEAVAGELNSAEAGGFCHAMDGETDISLGDIAEQTDGDLDGKDQTVQSDEGFDQFLDDATRAVHGLWCQRGGAECGPHELHALNDALTAFFQDKKGAQT